MTGSVCPVSRSASGRCPIGKESQGEGQHVGFRGCSLSGFSQTGDVRAAFNIPAGVDTEHWLRMRERRAINDVLYSNNFPTVKDINEASNIDTLPANELDLLAVALGAPARQVILRAEEIGPKTGWKDGFLSAEYGFVPPDSDAAVAALANSPGRIWSDLCERIPGCIARGRVRQSVAALPLVEGTEDVIPDSALWAALVSLGMLCSIYRYEEKYDGHDGVSVLPSKAKPDVDISDDVVEELKGIPRCIGLPYFQISKRMGRAVPHLSFPDQSSYNVKVRDPKSTYPYVMRFDNIDLRWPMFGERSEIAFLKGCAVTSGSFQHGPDAIASCQEAVMNKDVERLLREMIRLKEILEQMPNAFHSISPNPQSGENYVAGNDWVRWGFFSAPFSKRCPATSGLQFPPYLVMDAFLGRKKYDSFLGKEAVHLRAWQPSNLRAFIAAIEYHYSVPEFVAKSGDPRLMGVLDGIVEAYTGERGFMGVHRYKVYGILEIASKSGRTATNGGSGASDANGRPWETTHKQFSEAMKERLEPYRGHIPVEPHQMRGSFEECRYRSRIISRSYVDNDPNRSIAMVTLDIQDTGISFMPGDRLALMPLNNWEECAKVALALGLEDMLDYPVTLDATWSRFAEHLGSVTRASPTLLVKDIIRRGHLAPLTKELVLKIHSILRASSSVVLQVLATSEWPVRGSLGDLLQAAVVDTPQHIWDRAFDLTGDLRWLAELIPVEVPRTYSISNYPDELLPSTIDLTVSRSEYEVCSTFAGEKTAAMRSGVGSGFMNPHVSSSEEIMPIDEDILIGVSRPVSFQLPLDGAAPCAFFAGGSGIAPFRSFWQARAGRSIGRNILYLGVQSREKFCYEHELRELVAAGHMEIHTAFSRDSRGLAYDPAMRDLVEKPTPPRYIDALIVEQGETVCDLVMSKRLGGLGGYLYVCGSVSVFDSVMSGIRKAIYDHRTATMESADVILNTAFAERRFMLDVFMTPKPLPCNAATVPQSQLALHTGHRPGTPIWIAVHGKVYDVTSFCPMHPGGTLIIKSNAGVDCTRSFDELAHTTNPEVSSLLTKYYVGELTPKPDYLGNDEIGSLYDLWLDYLRTVVATLVAQQFELDRMMDPETDSTPNPGNYWFQGNLFSMAGVRLFYQYQSRLLQGGFSAMFGPKFQELVLKLSFSLANTSSEGAHTRLPDVLGIIARAKVSEEAVATSRQLSLVGEFINDSKGARFHEQGIMAYASKSAELDIALLEEIRQEACHGMDAFESIVDLDAASSSETDTVHALGTLLMQLLERMAKRLEIFYSNLARHSIYQPAIERNPARTRWRLLRQRIRDGSFFLFTRNASLGSAPSWKSLPNGATVDFDNVINQIRGTLAHAPPQQPLRSEDHSAGRQNLTLSAMHTARAQAARHQDGPSLLESRSNGAALRNMSTFIDKNMRSIRRLSRMPPPNAEQLLMLQGIGGAPDTPPSSRGSSRSPSRSLSLAAMKSHHQSYSLSERGPSLPPSFHRVNHHPMRSNSNAPVSMTGLGLQPFPPTPPLAPLDGNAAIVSMMGRLNVRSRRGASLGGAQVLSQPTSVLGTPHLGAAAGERGRHYYHSRPTSAAAGPVKTSATARSRSRSSTNSSLRSFILGQQAHRHMEERVAPTF
ncbi:hypothetical protein DL769_007568 [Monosporascus sp. CRB-8-3]|nr:hypothetical protein DL769_007568 [Monosporascus sp. CRB-8-3]